ncbi:MAG: 16S rRNA (cytosine(967)-C(5))-methyltransferase RsmB [Gammaproteobacteria bacterium]|nr:16S rRNA (cytosine(967)-C(5))-methyltransferase RsmB [Gammaproteobacteria bacterium]
MAVNPQPTARQLALRLCLKVVYQGQSLSSLMEQELITLNNERDRAFCSELCYGVCRFFFILKSRINQRLKKPLRSKDRDVEMILLLGLYQLLLMRVDDHAAVNESVKLLSIIRKHWAKGLVNGVLRAINRELSEENESEAFQWSDQEHEQAYPSWMVKLIKRDWPDSAGPVFIAGNQQAPMVLRLNTADIDPQHYLQELQGAGIQARLHDHVPGALVLNNPQSVYRLPGFEQGRVSVQDAAAQLAAGLLHSQPGMQVLDACAAPGGKTMHIMQSTKGLDVTAIDKDQFRLDRVKQNLQRAGLKATLIVADAAQPSTWFKGIPFDRILLDAPCSASGIIRRHPDIRLLRRETDIAGLVQQQHQLLIGLWPLLKTGGRLVYSTCSIFKDENERQVLKFIDMQTNCREVEIKSVQWGLKRPVGRQILPGFNDMDGFYYACLEKTA